MFNTTRLNEKARAAGALALGLLALSLLALSLAAPPAQADPCRVGEVETVAALRVSERLEIALADGRLARLAGLEASRPRGADPARALEAAADLERWIEGAPLEWRPGRAGPDRWGRVAGSLFIAGPEGAGLPSLAQALVEAGHARVDPAGVPAPCLAALYASEARARAAGRGLWSDPAQGALAGADAAAFAGRAGQVVLVEGRVAGVATSGGRVFVNFGGRGDPALVIPRTQARALERAGRPPAGWTGRMVRARGLVELRAGGPRVLVALPEAIEVAPAGAR